MMFWSGTTAMYDDDTRRRRDRWREASMVRQASMGNDDVEGVVF